VSSTPGLPSGTVTFLFTDIEGSTRLLRQLGERYEVVLADHQRLLRAAFAEHGGREIDTQGDSFFVAFGRAKDAVSAAVAGQRALAEHEWPEAAEVRVRMGIHTGEPVVGEERYVGLGVHRAARVASAGHGGQVLLSNATRDLVEDDLPAGVVLRDLGQHRLKDIDRPERICQLTVEGLPSRFPRLKTAGRGRRGPSRRAVVAVGVIVAVAGGAVGAFLVTERGPRSVRGLGTFDKEIVRVLDRVIPSQRAANAAVSGLSTRPVSLTRLHTAARSLEQTVLRAEGASSILVSSGRGERSAQKALSYALSKHAAYAEALVAAPAATLLSPGLAQQLVTEAGGVDSAYKSLDAAAGGSCCPPMPAGRDAAGQFVSLAGRNGKVSPVAVFVGRIENILVQSAEGRQEVTSALLGACSGSSTPADAARRIASAAANRQSILDQLVHLDTPTAQTAHVAGLLQAAISASIGADRHYRDWLSAAACPLPPTPQDVQTTDRRASVDKQAFVGSFDPLARRFSSRTWTVSEF
jgi:class 3 adenylate cyclase